MKLSIRCPWPSLLVFLVVVVSGTATALKCQSSNSTIIRDVKTLSTQEKQRLVAAMHKMKQIPSLYDNTTNAWDYLVPLHVNALIPAHEEHVGWRFLPFHRMLSVLWNRELQRAAQDDSLWFPYWDWTSQESYSAMMSLDYIGGVGDPDKDYVVEEGNFRKGLWYIDKKYATLKPEIQHQALARCPGNGLQSCLDSADEPFFLDTPDNKPGIDHQRSVGPFIHLPKNAPLHVPPSVSLYLEPDPRNLKCTWTDQECMRYYYNHSKNQTLRCKHYGAELPKQSDYDRCLRNLMPYSSNPIGQTGTPYNLTLDYYNPIDKDFRSCLEGINASDSFAHGPEALGISMHANHGAVHSHMGCSVAAPTSPNDPLFIHLHMNVDRVWAEFQTHYDGDKFFHENPELMSQEIPGFPGVTTRDILNTEKLGYTYECRDGEPSWWI